MVFDGQSDEGRGCWWCLMDSDEGKGCWWCLMDRVMRGKVAGGV